MKIRSGFVSNSSSASYVVKFNMNTEEFIHEIYHALGFDYFDINFLYTDLKERIEQYEEGLEAERKDKNGKFHFRNKKHLNEMKSQLKHLETISSINSIDTSGNEEGNFVVELVPAIKWILGNMYNINVTEEFDNVVLNAWTVMHNSCNDIPQIIKDIVIHFSFERPEIRKICKVIEDSQI